jgi:hypothetical protein
MVAEVGGSQPSYSPDGSDAQVPFSPPEVVVPVQSNWGVAPSP